jgi:hypothetical protein
MTYKTCNHSYDTGGTCNSAAVTGRDYCVYHLRYRARQLRRAQARARNQRFNLQLPPLEDMFAVQLALNQLVEAVAADMLDLKRAQFLLSAVRTAGQFLRHADKWTASPYHTDQPAPAIDLAAEYGLPADLNLDTPPEVAFPPPDVILSEERSDESKGPFVSAHLAKMASDAPPMPFSGHYCGDHHSHECECLRIRADYPLTPENVEILEVCETLGSDAAAVRGKQLDSNRQRRQLRNDRKRYVAIALERNLRRAADLMAERKLAERAAQQSPAAQIPDSGCPIPPSVGGVGVSPDTVKKPVASAVTGDTVAAKEATTA